MLIPQIRVAVADDHPVLLDGLKTLLSADAQLQIVGEATRFAELRGLLLAQPVDVLVLDLNDMGTGPLTVVQGLLRDFPSLSIVIFSSSIDLAPELLRAGVRGYVAKEEVLDELVSAIKAAHAGQTRCSPVVQDYVDRATRANKGFRLAPQEVNVLRLTARGLGTPEIAADLCIGVRVVQNYITTLYRKTGCRTRQELADWYRRIYLPRKGLEE
jgi:DNA-binding NarL/FixJ family response regulator